MVWIKVRATTASTSSSLACFQNGADCSSLIDYELANSIARPSPVLALYLLTSLSPEESIH
jgi:hypothetical protein